MELQAYKPQIEAALEHSGNTHTFEDVEQAVIAGELQLWGGVRSVILTEIQDYPQYKVLNYFIAGGNRVELSAMTPLIEEWGRSVGAKRATLYGRKGWARSFLTREQGWNESLIIMEKEL